MPPKRIIHLDLETYSEAGYQCVDGKWSGKGLPAVGMHHYARHPSADVLCMAYGYTADDVKTWTPDMEPPHELLDHIEQGGLVAAWNSGFEFEVWNRVFPHWPQLKLEQMRCSQARAQCYGLPAKLGDAAKFFPGGEQKDTKGKTLLNRYSRPHTPTKNKPTHRRVPLGEELEALVEYCKQDVVTEIGIEQRCPPMTPFELQVWLADQRIVNRGVAVDMETVDRLQVVVDSELGKAAGDIQLATYGEVWSPSQIQKILGYIKPLGYRHDTLDGPTIEAELAKDNLHPAVRDVLQARQKASHSSVKKLAAIRRRVCDDNRLRGLFKYCGAERTGRWAGRGVQPQNFPRPHKGYGERENPFDGPVENLDDVASSTRGVLWAEDGHEFIQADYSAIEAVVLACLADETWRVDLFKDKGDIYSRTAAMITGREEYTPEGKHVDRQMGKVAELASGYGGSVGAWRAFGATGTTEEIKANVDAWRKASPNVVSFWYDQERAAKNAIANPYQLYQCKGIKWICHSGVLRCMLPSGRTLYYHRAELKDTMMPWGQMKPQICYYGQDTYTRQWGELRTYGGKITENIVQATARDLLAHAMVLLDKAGWRIVMHVHDEIVCEERTGTRTVEELCAIMTTFPKWAEGWPVRAEGWKGRRYRK